jgi:uridine kinase
MKEIFRSKQFWIGLAIRVALIPFFSSHYASDLFIPFLDQAVRSPLANPWQSFPAEYFPYGSVLFSLLFLPRFLAYKLIGEAALGAGALGLTLLKLPLLFMDIGLFVALVSLSPGKRRELSWFYWLNPILLFISYVHCQLDVCATAFLVFSLVAVLRRRPTAGGVLMALAMLCKFHVVLTVPFILAYFWSRSFAREASLQIGKFLGTFVSLSLLGFLPLAFAHKFFYAAAASPQAQQIFAWKLAVGEHTALYLGAAVVMAALGRLCIASPITDDGLVYGTGFLLGTLLLVTNPAPGWFFWFVPFISLVYANYLSAPRSLYWFFGTAYLTYFAVVPALAEEQLPGYELLNGLCFTAMQLSLAALMFFVWRRILSHQAPIYKYARPTVIGIAGDSGVGKNTLSSLLGNLFDPRHTAMLEGDDYHRWERNHARWSEFTHLNPQANNLGQLAINMGELCNGKGISQPHYDHNSGHFTLPQETLPRRNIIVQGLHTFYLRQMRDSFDLKIFLNPARELRLLWKLQRDVSERGHSLERVLENCRKQEQDSLLHVQPQKELADWVIEYYPLEPFSESDILAGKADISRRCGLRCYFWNDAPLADLLTELSTLENLSVNVSRHETDFGRIKVDIQGNPNSVAIRGIVDVCFPSLREITLGRKAPQFSGDLAGVIQLFALALLRHKGAQKAYPQNGSASVATSQKRNVAYGNISEVR